MNIEGGRYSPMFSVTSALANALASDTGLEMLEVHLSPEKDFLALNKKY